MSNRPEDDPIGHAAKFLWLFAIIPVIFGAMVFFLPKGMSHDPPAWSRAAPFVVAALLALIGVGVHRRVIAAAWAGIGLFAAGFVGIVYAAVAGQAKQRAALIFALLLYWPIRKLLDAIRAIREERSRPPA